MRMVCLQAQLYICAMACVNVAVIKVSDVDVVSKKTKKVKYSSAQWLQDAKDALATADERKLLAADIPSGKELEYIPLCLVSEVQRIIDNNGDVALVTQEP